MEPITRFFRSASSSVSRSGRTVWKRFRSLALWLQVAIVIAVLALIITIAVASGSEPEEAPAVTKTVTLSTLSELESGTTGSSIIGTIRSISQADILAQNGGTVRAVNTRVGASVPAGFVIASLDNATEAAQVLQAQGAYDAALAGQRITGIQAGSITSIQAGGAKVSFSEAQTAARTTARSVYTALDTTLEGDVDTFFGGPTPSGPRLLINPGPTNDLDRQRDALDDRFDTWEQQLANASSKDPNDLLDQAFANADALSRFLTQLATAANERNSRATPAQFAALASARAEINAQLAAISAARSSLITSRTNAQVGNEQVETSSAQNASASASVKQALGNLRAAQAAYERTIVRAPIGGTVNFLPIRVGDYVTNLQQVATVAQNGALEILAYVSEEDRQSIAVGMRLAIEGGHEGIITTVAPALDPVTQQIEVRIAVDQADDLVNGQTVRITLPAATAERASPTTASTTASGAAKPVLIPLTALKLTSSARVVFSVGEDSRLVSLPVEIGDVRGERIEILTEIPTDLRIVTDARGLSEGQKVTVANP